MSAWPWPGQASHSSGYATSLNARYSVTALLLNSNRLPVLCDCFLHVGLFPSLFLVPGFDHGTWGPHALLVSPATSDVNIKGTALIISVDDGLDSFTVQINAVVAGTPSASPPWEDSVATIWQVWGNKSKISSERIASPSAWSVRGLSATLADFTVPTPLALFLTPSSASADAQLPGNACRAGTGERRAGDPLYRLGQFRTGAVGGAAAAGVPQGPVAHLVPPLYTGRGDVSTCIGYGVRRVWAGRDAKRGGSSSARQGRGAGNFGPEQGMPRLGRTRSCPPAHRLTALQLLALEVHASDVSDLWAWLGRPAMAPILAQTQWLAASLNPSALEKLTVLKNLLKAVTKLLSRATSVLRAGATRKEYKGRMLMAALRLWQDPFPWGEAAMGNQAASQRQNAQGHVPFPPSMPRTSPGSSSTGGDGVGIDGPDWRRPQLSIRAGAYNADAYSSGAGSATPDSGRNGGGTVGSPVTEWEGGGRRRDSSRFTFPWARAMGARASSAHAFIRTTQAQGQGEWVRGGEGREMRDGQRAWYNEGEGRPQGTDRGNRSRVHPHGAARGTWVGQAPPLPAPLLSLPLMPQAYTVGDRRSYSDRFSETYSRETYSDRDRAAYRYPGAGEAPLPSPSQHLHHGAGEAPYGSLSHRASTSLYASVNSTEWQRDGYLGPYPTAGDGFGHNYYPHNYDAHPPLPLYDRGSYPSPCPTPHPPNHTPDRGSHGSYGTHQGRDGGEWLHESNPRDQQSAHTPTTAHAAETRGTLGLGPGVDLTRVGPGGREGQGARGDREQMIGEYRGPPGYPPGSFRSRDAPAYSYHWSAREGEGVGPLGAGVGNSAQAEYYSHGQNKQGQAYLDRDTQFQQPNLHTQAEASPYPAAAWGGSFLLPLPAGPVRMPMHIPGPSAPVNPYSAQYTAGTRVHSEAGLEEHERR